VDQAGLAGGGQSTVPIQEDKPVPPLLADSVLIQTDQAGTQFDGSGR
jgi:hypothetical protein